MTTPQLHELTALVRGATVHDLGRPYQNGMPQSPNHPRFRHSLDRRHGDATRDGGGSAAADIIVTGCHVGTHIDALCHVSQDGLLFGGVAAAALQSGGRFAQLGIDAVAPHVGRALLLDVCAHRGVACLDGGYEITVEDLEATVAAQGTEPAPGDVLFVRSGWGSRWAEGDAYVGKESGVPGVSEAGAIWLADHQPRAVGADTIAFECLRPGAGHAALPAHRVLLVERGINIIETLDLEGVSQAGAHEFVVVLSQMNVVGATGAPVRPLAIVP